MCLERAKAELPKGQEGRSAFQGVYLFALPTYGTYVVHAYLHRVDFKVFDVLIPKITLIADPNKIHSRAFHFQF